MTIDISKIRPGDRVTPPPLEVIECLSKSKDFVWVVTSVGVKVPLYAADIAAHHPAPREFQVGDRVKSGSLYFGTVRAVDGDEAWVRWDDHDANWSAEVQALTLVEGGE